MAEIENNSSWFPWGRLIIGTLIGGFFTTVMSVITLIHTDIITQAPPTIGHCFLYLHLFWA